MICFSKSLAFARLFILSSTTLNARRTNMSEEIIEITEIEEVVETGA